MSRRISGRRCADAVAEERVLLAHDLGRHLQDGLRALLQRFHQPVGGLASCSVRNALSSLRGARRDAGVEALVDQHARHRLGVQLDAASRRPAPARISTSGTSGCGGVAVVVRAPAWDRARGSRRSCRPGPRHRRRTAPSAGASRAAPADRGCRAAPAIAGSSRLRSASWAARHSFRSRANRPTGSKRIMRARTASTRSSGSAIAVGDRRRLARSAGRPGTAARSGARRSSGRPGRGSVSRSCSPR